MGEGAVRKKEANKWMGADAQEGILIKFWILAKFKNITYDSLNILLFLIVVVFMNNSLQSLPIFSIEQMTFVRFPDSIII